MAGSMIENLPLWSIAFCRMILAKVLALLVQPLLLLIPALILNLDMRNRQVDTPNHLWSATYDCDLLPVSQVLVAKVHLKLLTTSQIYAIGLVCFILFPRLPVHTLPWVWKTSDSIPYAHLILLSGPDSGWLCLVQNQSSRHPISYLPHHHPTHFDVVERGVEGASFDCCVQPLWIIPYLIAIVVWPGFLQKTQIWGTYALINVLLVYPYV